MYHTGRTKGESTHDPAFCHPFVDANIPSSFCFISIIKSSLNEPGKLTRPGLIFYGASHFSPDEIASGQETE